MHHGSTSKTRCKPEKPLRAQKPTERKGTAEEFNSRTASSSRKIRLRSAIFFGPSSPSTFVKLSAESASRRKALLIAVPWRPPRGSTKDSPLPFPTPHPKGRPPHDTPSIF